MATFDSSETTPTTLAAPGVGGTARTRAASPRRLSWGGRPLISTIDWYVLRAFVKNYLIALFVLIALYVVLDMVFNFDEFVQVNGRGNVEEAVTIWQTLAQIVDYYFYQAFRIFNYLAGVIPVVAAAFTLMRMSRFNELAALLAAGIPLGRVAAPIIAASLVINGGLLFVNQEIIVPRMIDKLTRDRGDVTSGLDNRVLRAMPDGDHSVLFAGRYTPPKDSAPATIEVLDVLNSPPGAPPTELTADDAVYNRDGSWTLTNGSLTVLRASGSSGAGDVTPVAKLVNTTVNPETIALFVSRGDFVDLLSSARIRELLESKTDVGRVDLMRVRDARWANYVLNLILVLLAIPCVLTREPMALRTATARIFVLIGACMATIFVCQTLAGQPPQDLKLANVWPAIMAWLPIFTFGPLSIWLLDRLKT